ncbi:MAG: hypothetical protein ABS52_05965 [Gemmatimonadetes bacterium SCN 70-22]|nr:MAG: hypothetical protein ABS52_05965 [Gemmatimonadetes bacterium SCN 70-22]
MECHAATGPGFHGAHAVHGVAEAAVQLERYDMGVLTAMDRLEQASAFRTQRQWRSAAHSLVPVNRADLQPRGAGVRFCPRKLSSQ